MGDFEKFKEQLQSKEKFYSSLTGKKLVIKNMNMFLMFETNLKWKRWNIITNCISIVTFYC